MDFGYDQIGTRHFQLCRTDGPAPRFQARDREGSEEACRDMGGQLLPAQLQDLVPWLGVDGTPPPASSELERE
jgi:hypothetical protein